tara:strand:+ start:3870 stop:4748 length:879 start_codon:yes stop_codon:yes gene_type:complete
MKKIKDINNPYIGNLKKQKKLIISIDKKKRFNFKIGNKVVGKQKIIFAGPCSVESRSMIINFSKKLKSLGVNGIRGGAYKPCTFPIRKEVNGWREGIKFKGLQYLSEVKKITGLPIVSELMDARQIDKSLPFIDVIQVGTRNFQNYTLLDELGKIDKPIMLKRGTWGTIDEILGSVERILNGGNNKVMICLRGIIGAPSYRHVFPSIRWSPDIMMIPALKELTNVPIIYDPSHSTGYRNFVPAISKAAIVAGADGLIIESHPNPEKSISDPDQAIKINQLKEIVKWVKKYER